MPKKPSPQAKIITNKSNVAYLSNFTGSSGFLLITKSKTYLFTDFRYIERAKNSIKKGIQIVDTTRMWRNQADLKKNWQKVLAKHRITAIGVEESDLTVSRYKKFKKITPKTRFIDISGEIESKREIKTPTEIAKIKKSQAINEKVLTEIKKIIQDYKATHFDQKTKSKTAFSSQKSRQNLCTCTDLKELTEIHLAHKIKELGAKFGAEDVSFDPIVAFGKNSALPHHEPSSTKLKPSDVILIDMGMKYQGYCSDMTRTFLPKSATAKQKEIYNLVLQAQLNAIKHIKPGITGTKADKLSRDIIEKAGYGDQYGHAGGHGIGLDIHETPSLSQSYKTPLRPNSIITIEPGIYLTGEFGVRIEDMLLVQKNGNQNLTKFSKSPLI